MSAGNADGAAEKPGNSTSSSLNDQIDYWDLFVSKGYGKQAENMKLGESNMSPSSSSRPLRSLTSMLTEALNLPASSQPSACTEHMSPCSSDSGEVADTSCAAASKTDGPADCEQKPKSQSGRAKFRETYGYDKGRGKTSRKLHKKKYKAKKKMEEKSPLGQSSKRHSCYSKCYSRRRGAVYL